MRRFLQPPNLGHVLSGGLQTQTKGWVLFAEREGARTEACRQKEERNALQCFQLQQWHLSLQQRLWQQQLKELICFMA